MEEQKLRKLVREEIRSILVEVEEKDKNRSYDYPDAGDDAPEEVKQAIQRFREMDETERDTNILLWWLLGDGTPPYKMSKEDSDYSDDTGMQEQACMNCEFLYLKPTSGEYVCSQIRGKVRPEGWCRLWKLAETIEENE